MSDTKAKVSSNNTIVGRRGLGMTAETLDPHNNHEETNQTKPLERAKVPSKTSDSGPWLLAATLETERTASGLDDEYAGKPANQSIVAIGFVLARMLGEAKNERLEVKTWRTGGKSGMSERNLISSFWQSFDTWKPRLVTFNGRGHLIPVLRFASMRHGLTAKWLHEAGDRWTGYHTRFNPEYHTDLMDIFSDFHASPYPSLPEVANALHFNASTSENLSPSMRAVENAGTIFKAYLRWRVFVGAMTKESMEEAEKSLEALRGAAS